MTTPRSIPPSAKALPASAVGRWRYALKPASWPKLLAPAFVGQVMGMTIAERVDVPGVVFGALFTVSLLVFIVLMNDWGDQAVDAHKRRMFPESCSPKTIVDGILPASAVFRAGVAAGVFAAVSAAAAGLILGRPWLAVLGVVAVLLFVAYTLPPVRLNYRGGGELLEMVGVGGVLPLWNMLAHTSRLPTAAVWAFAGMMLGALASAVASGLSDEVSDREGGKRTFATTLGNVRARALTEVALGLAALAFLAGGMAFGSAALVVTGARTVIGVVRVVLASKTAVTNAFHALTRYKSELHAALWGSWVWLAMMIIAEHAVRGAAAPW